MTENSRILPATVRHLKRGFEYEVLGEAEVQLSKPTQGVIGGGIYRPVREGERLTVYRGQDGKLWCRFTDEFMDGRFEPIDAKPAPHWLDMPIPEDLVFAGTTYRAGFRLGSILKDGERFAQVAQDRFPAVAEREEFCAALGCTDKPGVPLRFVKELQARNSELWARVNELLRSWDKATPTERQELDRMRRGWGPSSPTERMRRRSDVVGCLQVISMAMTELTVSEEDEDAVPQDARERIDHAYGLLNARHTEMLAVVRAVNDDPQEWPDIKAAEERGAMQAQIAPNEMLMADNRRMRAAGLKLAEAAMHVVREFDGTHRLSLAAAEWAKAIADEGGRGERYAGPPAFEPGRIAFEVRWPAPRETEWEELTDEQRAVWARVQAAVRAASDPEVRS